MTNKNHQSQYMHSLLDSVIVGSLQQLLTNDEKRVALLLPKGNSNANFSVLEHIPAINSNHFAALNTGKLSFFLC